MEASRVTIGDKTYELGVLRGKRKTNLRRKLAIEYIQSKPAGEYISIGDFQDICRFTTNANTWSFIQRMVRDGVIQRHEGSKKKSYFYSVTGAVRVTKPKDVPAQLPVPDIQSPDISSFVADMQKLGVEFTITISNKQE